MDNNPAALWWVIAGVLVAAELGTGSFYLLMLALGACAGAVAAHLGLGGAAQIVVAAGVGAAATAAWHWKRGDRPTGPPVEANRDVILDVGEHVHVSAWQPDGTARVHYRGAAWTARHQGPLPPAPGNHRIVAVDGNRLVLAPASSTD